MRWETWAEGAEAADAILAAVRVPVEKAKPSILTRGGYNAAVRSLVRLLSKIATEPDQRAVRQAAKRLDARWDKMRPKERDQVIESAAATILDVPPIIIPKVTRALYDAAGRLVVDTKAASARAHKLQVAAEFATEDERVIRFAAQSQGNYITDSYGRRAVAFEQKARDVVAKGIERGLDYKQIGAEMRAEVVGPLLRKSEVYWEQVASIHVSRARSWGQLTAFEEAGIERARWVSVLDEVTSQQCRFMHGRAFSVPASKQRYVDVEESADPEAVKRMQPWIRVGKSEGEEVLFVQLANGGRRAIARVEESGYGRRDDTGKFSKVAPEAVLQALGVTCPPAHPLCRSTIEPA